MATASVICFLALCFGESSRRVRAEFAVKKRRCIAFFRNSVVSLGVAITCDIHVGFDKRSNCIDFCALNPLIAV